MKDIIEISSKDLTTEMMQFAYNQFKSVVGLLIGYFHLSKHLQKVGVNNGPVTCRLSEEDSYSKKI